MASSSTDPEKRPPGENAGDTTISVSDSENKPPSGEKDGTDGKDKNAKGEKEEKDEKGDGGFSAYRVRQAPASKHTAPLTS